MPEAPRPHPSLENLETLDGDSVHRLLRDTLTEHGEAQADSVEMHIAYDPKSRSTVRLSGLYDTLVYGQAPENRDGSILYLEVLPSKPSQGDETSQTQPANDKTNQAQTPNLSKDGKANPRRCIILRPSVLDPNDDSIIMSTLKGHLKKVGIQVKDAEAEAEGKKDLGAAVILDITGEPTVLDELPPVFHVLLQNQTNYEH